MKYYITIYYFLLIININYIAKYKVKKRKLFLFNNKSKHYYHKFYISKISQLDQKIGHLEKQVKLYKKNINLSLSKLYIKIIQNLE